MTWKKFGRTRMARFKEHILEQGYENDYWCGPKAKVLYYRLECANYILVFVPHGGGPHCAMWAVTRDVNAIGDAFSSAKGLYASPRNLRSISNAAATLFKAFKDL